ncbi:hypothetical protein IQ06DRAFT_23103 [Phaeosphaeriaceae sp. SRC1lsM3a]|nr:hypothetical protein IQ06DRAFT_23103 [Stagonospora sp. SRC1lsM3a]
MKSSPAVVGAAPIGILLLPNSRLETSAGGRRARVLAISAPPAPFTNQDRPLFLLAKRSCPGYSCVCTIATEYAQQCSTVRETTAAAVKDRANACIKHRYFVYACIPTAAQ